MREIEFLKTLTKCYKNETLKLTTLFYNNFDIKGHIFMELKKYGENLHKGTIKKTLKKLNQIVSITTDLLQGLLFLKGNDIIHADLKPENILFIDDSKEHVVICDFGLSMKLKEVNLKYYVQSMWYRAPEVVFNIEYDYCIDLWSLGVV